MLRFHKPARPSLELKKTTRSFSHAFTAEENKQILEGEATLNERKKALTSHAATAKFFDFLKKSKMCLLLIAKNKINLEQICLISQMPDHINTLKNVLFTGIGFDFFKQDLIAFEDFFKELIAGNGSSFRTLFSEYGYKFVTEEDKHKNKLFSVKEFIAVPAEDRYTLAPLFTKDVYDAIKEGHTSVKTFMEIAPKSRFEFVETAQLLIKQKLAL